MTNLAGLLKTQLPVLLPKLERHHEQKHADLVPFEKLQTAFGLLDGDLLVDAVQHTIVGALDTQMYQPHVHVFEQTRQFVVDLIGSQVGLEEQVLVAKIGDRPADVLRPWQSDVDLVGDHLDLAYSEPVEPVDLRGNTLGRAQPDERPGRPPHRQRAESTFVRAAAADNDAALTVRSRVVLPDELPKIDVLPGR